MNTNIFSYIINEVQLDNEIRLLPNPPCKLYSQITGFISPDLNNINHLGIPKPQNAFILYRKNYAAKHKSSDYQNLAREKHKLIYGKKDSTTGNQLPKGYTFIDQQPVLLQKIEVDNNNNNYYNPNSSSFASFLPCSISSDNILPINYDNNIINKTNALFQSTQFNNLNDKNPLEGFQQYIQTEQTDVQLYRDCLDLLDFVTRYI
nr:1131_t:CDS:2 [Entrophospora candida]